MPASTYSSVRRAIQRFALEQRIEVAIDSDLHVGRRVHRLNRFEFGARTHIVAGVVISARQLEPAARIVRVRQYIALERDRSFSGAPDIDQCDAAPQVALRKITLGLAKAFVGLR